MIQLISYLVTGGIELLGAVDITKARAAPTGERARAPLVRHPPCWAGVIVTLHDLWLWPLSYVTQVFLHLHFRHTVFAQGP